MSTYLELPEPPADAEPLSVRGTLPEVGEKIYNYSHATNSWVLCTIITLGKCRKMNRSLWGDKDTPQVDETAPYAANERTRAYSFDDGSEPPTFRIMAFLNLSVPGGLDFNKFVMRRSG